MEKLVLGFAEYGGIVVVQTRSVEIAELLDVLLLGVDHIQIFSYSAEYSANISQLYVNFVQVKAFSDGLTHQVQGCIGIVCGGIAGNRSHHCVKQGAMEGLVLFQQSLPRLEEVYLLLQLITLIQSICP